MRKDLKKVVRIWSKRFWIKLPQLSFHLRWRTYKYDIISQIYLSFNFHGSTNMVSKLKGTFIFYFFIWFLLFIITYLKITVYRIFSIYIISSAETISE